MCDDIEVIPNVIDVERYGHENRAAPTAAMLWMRTFEPTYQPTMAIEALAHLRDRGVDASLTMAGQDQGALDLARHARGISR